MNVLEKLKRMIRLFAYGGTSACLSLWLTACATTSGVPTPPKKDPYQPPANLLLVKEPPEFPYSLTNGELFDLAKAYLRGWLSCNDDKVAIAEDAGKVLAPPPTTAPVEEKKWWQFWK